MNENPKTALPVLELWELEDILDRADKDEFAATVGRTVDWHGNLKTIVQHKNSLAVQLELECSRCGKNPITVYARSGLHSGAFCYVYDASGKYLANLRDQDYTCESCQESKKSGEVK